MAIAYVSGTGVNTGSASSHTHAHNVGAGTERFVVVLFDLINATVLPTGVTYAGVAMTQVASRTMINHTGKQYVYVLHNPASGSNNVVVSLDGNAVIALCVNSFTGVNQAASVDATGSNNTSGSNSSSVSVTTTQDNCWLVGISKDDAGGATAGANTTSGGTGTTAGGDRSWYTATAQTPAGVKTMNYSAAGSSGWDSLAVSISPPIAVATNSNFLLFM